MTSDHTFQAAVAEFVGAFEEVFGRDWEYSKVLLGPPNLDAFVAPGFTFINPGVDDEVEDWGARAKLLQTYRRLLETMNKHGLQPKNPW